MRASRGLKRENKTHKLKRSIVKRMFYSKTWISNEQNHNFSSPSTAKTRDQQCSGWGGGRVRPYHILNNFCPRLCFMRVDFSVKESTPISRTVAMSWKSQPHSNKKKNQQRWQMFRPNLKQYKTSFKNSFPVFFSKLFLHQKNIIAHAVKKFAPIADGGWKKKWKSRL